MKAYLISSRWLDLAAFFISLFLLGFAAYLEHTRGLVPCPLCMIQRGIFLVISLLFLLGYLLPLPKLGHRLWHLSTLVVSVLGMLAAARQIWILHSPANTVSCTASLDHLLRVLPIQKAIPAILQGSSQCNDSHWTWLSLSLPSWSLLFFTFFMLVAAYQIARKQP